LSAQLGLRQILFASRSVFVVELRSLDPEYDEGFDAVLVELVASSADPGGAFLTLKGFANPGGLGYAHFSAGIGLRLDAEQNATTEVAFVSQAPPPQTNTGIFGQTVQLLNSNTHVLLRMYRTPLFNR